MQRLIEMVQQVDTGQSQSSVALYLFEESRQ